MYVLLNLDIEFEIFKIELYSIINKFPSSRVVKTMALGFKV